MVWQAVPVNERNSKCSCGSGLKYKKCCLIRQELDAQAQAAIEEKEFQEWLAKDLETGQQNLKDAKPPLIDRGVFIYDLPQDGVK